LPAASWATAKCTKQANAHSADREGENSVQSQGSEQQGYSAEKRKNCLSHAPGVSLSAGKIFTQLDVDATGRQIESGASYRSSDSRHGSRGRPSSADHYRTRHYCYSSLRARRENFSSCTPEIRQRTAGFAYANHPDAFLIAYRNAFVERRLSPPHASGHSIIDDRNLSGCRCCRPLPIVPTSEGCWFTMAKYNLPRYVLILNCVTYVHPDCMSLCYEIDYARWEASVKLRMLFFSLSSASQNVPPAAAGHMSHAFCRSPVIIDS
jgi:hypothetical protein